jgi:hypothetical protein
VASASSDGSRRGCSPLPERGRPGTEKTQPDRAQHQTFGQCASKSPSVALPWSWKPLWAPLVDRFGARRAWIAPCLAALAALELTRSEGLFLMIVDGNAEGLAGWKHHEHVVLRGILSRSGEPMGRPLLRVETVERSEKSNDSR